VDKGQATLLPPPSEDELPPEDDPLPEEVLLDDEDPLAPPSPDFDEPELEEPAPEEPALSLPFELSELLEVDFADEDELLEARLSVL